MSKPACPTVETLSDYCLGKLPEPDLEQIDAHLSDCGNCQNTVELLDHQGDTLIAELRKPAAADAFRSEPQLAQALAAARQLASANPPSLTPLQSPSPASRQQPQPAATGDADQATKLHWPAGKAPRTVAEFVQCLVASGLMMTVAEIRAVVEGLPKAERPTDAKSLATLLVKTQKISLYQARVILQGHPAGLVLGEREIVDLLGRGGMGQVFKVRHRRLDRIEALKVLSSRQLPTPDAVERFQKEAKAAARLSHPNIVTTHDAGRHAGVHYLAMEFVDGCDLSRTVQQQGPLPVEQAVGCILQAAEGLRAAHEAGIIHRDIKPHNLLLDRQGRVKVLDLGLARFSGSGEASRAIQQGLTQSGQVMGTLAYMSPEQALDMRAVDARADIYSLGCTLFFLLTGRPPFGGETIAQQMFAHRDAPIPSLQQFRPDVSPELNAVFIRMLAKNPADRYAAMAEVIFAL